MELRIDVLDALQLEKYENALEDVKNYKPVGTKASEVIKEQCVVVRSFFDKVFGEGTGDKLFGGSWNFREHYNKMAEFIKQTNEQVIEENKKMSEGVNLLGAN